MKVEMKDLGSAARKNTNAQADALKRAAIRTLTRAAGQAQDKLLAAEKKIFRAPVPFTTNTQGYRITPARRGPGDPQSKFTIKQQQSDYLRFPIEGGVRTPGDAGTSDKFVFKPTRHAALTPSGSLQRFYTKQLVSESKRKRPIRGGGVFFGRLPGHTDIGWVLRPGRTLPLYKVGRGGRMVLARPHDHAKVHNVNVAMMLVEADKQSKHKPILPYAELMRAAMDEQTAELGRRLQEELRK